MLSLRFRFLLALLCLPIWSSLLAAQGSTFRGKTLTEWDTLLRDANPTTRARAATAIGLGRFGKEAVPILIRAMQDAEELVVSSAIQSLGMIGPEAVDAIPVLVNLLHREDRTHWGAALSTLRNIGPAAVPALLTLPRVRFQRNGRFRQVFRISVRGREEAVVPPLVEALGDARDTIRLRAIGELSELGPIARGAVPALTEALQDRNTGIRAAALDAILSIAPTDEAVAFVYDRDGPSATSLPGLLQAGSTGRQLVLRSFREGTPEWKRIVLQAAHTVLDEVGFDVLPLLVAGMEDSDSNIRAHAVGLLFACPIDLAAFLPQLRRLAQDTSVEYPRAFHEFLLSSAGALPEQLPGFKKALRAENPQVRDAASARIRTLGLTARPLLPAALEACEDHTPVIRTNALSLLPLIAPDAPVVVRRLCKSLKDDDVEVRNQAATSLGAIGPSVRRIPFSDISHGHDAGAALGEIAVEALRMRLTDPSLAVRVRAARSLQQIGCLDRSLLHFLALVAIDALQWLSHSVDGQTRILALHIIRDMGPAAAEVLPLLLVGLHDRNTHIQEVVVEILQQLGPAARPALPWLRRMLLKGQGEPFAAALVALGEWGIPALREGLQRKDRTLTHYILRELDSNPACARQMLPDIVTCLDSDNELIRNDCMYMLPARMSDDPRLVPICLRLLENPNVWVRRDALRILGGMGPKARAALPAICALLVDPGSPVRLAVPEVIARLGADDRIGIPDLVETLHCADPGMRITAAEALAMVLNPGKNIREALGKALNDPHEGVRLAVCQSLVRLGDYQTPIKPLGQLLKSGKATTKIEAGLLLWRLDHRAGVVPTLCELLHEKDASTIQQAMAALVHLQARCPEVKGYVRPLVNSRNFGVRRSAMSIMNIPFKLDRPITSTAIIFPSPALGQ